MRRYQEKLVKLLNEYGSDKIAIQELDIGEVAQLETWVAK